MASIDILKERAENMRKNPTFHEKKFAERMELAGIFYKSQRIIGNFIVDFLIGRTIVEIDGCSHFETFQAQYDSERTAYLESRGYSVIRVRNEHVVSFDMNRIKPKRRKSNMCPKSQRQPSKQRISESKERKAEIKDKPKKTIQITEPIIRPQISKQPRFSYAELRKGAPTLQKAV